MTRRIKLIVGYGAAIGVLMAVFMMYTRPDVLVMLADQLWACF